jgi:hypothetical protein
LKSRLQAANNSSDIIDYSSPVQRVERLLQGTETLRDDVNDKKHWLTDVMEKTVEFNTAVTEMEEWLPKVEKSIEGLGPMSTDLAIIKDQIKAVQVNTSCLRHSTSIGKVNGQSRNKLFQFMAFSKLYPTCHLGNFT